MHDKLLQEVVLLVLVSFNVLMLAVIAVIAYLLQQRGPDDE